MRRKLDEEPKADTSEQVADQVRFAMEMGYSDGEVRYLADWSWAYRMWESKDPSRSIGVDVARLVAKFRPDHTHSGQACDVAGCPNSPDWQKNRPVGIGQPWSAYDLNDEQLANLSPPQPLIEGVLMRDTLAVLYGQPGAMKSFLALDWSMSVASELEAWHGRTVLTGGGYYIVGEGAHGVSRRVDAWKAVRGGHVSDSMLWRPRAVNFLDNNDVAGMIEHMANVLPALIVIDTLARCMPGGDENSTQDVGRVVAQLDRVREAAGGACVLVVHHTTKDGLVYRGSSALAGAADTMIEVSRPNTDRSIVNIKCTKQKDAEEFLPTTLQIYAAQHSIVLEQSDGTSAWERMQADSRSSRTSLVDQVEAVVRATPGVGVRGLQDAIGGRQATVRETVTAAVESGRVVRRAGPGGRLEHYLPEPDDGESQGVLL